MQGEVECQMDRCGANDKRALARCNFCGSVEGLRCYPTDILGVDWYGCEDCVALIRDEDWNNLIDRILAAFAAVLPIPKDEQVVFRRELENQLKAFNPFCPHPV